ncbi:MAG: ribonuclease H-like domain-containing protein [Candidatus Pacebacteria bacterium]|nr:ribonuclease H-like domain-containing protein [Candidatus Paceibacterota bacterium]
MRQITFDIETANTLPSFDRGNLAKLELALVGIHDSENNEFSSYTKEELPKLWPILERADMLIGYNSDAFDIPLLNRYYPGDLSTIRSLDLMIEVQKVLGRRLRLQSLAEATLGRGKKGDGLKSIEWWQQGLVDKVREYCIEDVRLTRELFDYAITHQGLKYKDFKQKRDVKIDTSAWLIEQDLPSLTHTLPF